MLLIVLDEIEEVESAESAGKHVGDRMDKVDARVESLRNGGPEMVRGCDGEDPQV